MPGESDMKSTQNGVRTPSSPGTRFVDTVDTEDPEYIKDLQRPASIKVSLIVALIVWSEDKGYFNFSGGPERNGTKKTGSTNFGI